MKDFKFAGFLVSVLLTTGWGAFVQADNQTPTITEIQSDDSFPSRYIFELIVEPMQK